MTDTWIHACATGELAIGSAKVVKGEHLGLSYQIAVFRTEAEGYYATDNLCPHEGYPLVQGYVKDCVLTCAWHNFKFKLEDGECIKGDEAVTTHPVRVRAEAVEFQLANAGQQVDVPKTFASLEEGLLDDQMGRVARDVVRLLNADVPAETLLVAAARFDAERAEWGTNHGLPVAVDAMQFLDRYRGIEAALPIMQAMECAAERNIRRPIRVLADPIAPTDSAEATGRELRELIEAEDYTRAEGLLLGGLAAGLGRKEIEPWFLTLCCDHFLGFGHPLIYAIKAFDFLEVVGFDYAPHLLPALLFRIANSTREDTLPPMLHLAERLDIIEGRMDSWRSNDEAQSNKDSDLGKGSDLGKEVQTAILDGTKHDAIAAVEAALDAGASPMQIVDALSAAASERLLRFDPAHDLSPDTQDGWLDITHGLTYANAIRKTFSRFSRPEAIRLLFYCAHFIQRTKSLDQAAQPLPVTAAAAPSLASIKSAVLAKNSPLATALVRSYLQDGGDLSALQATCEDYAIADHYTRPIVVAHAIKTCIAAFEESAALGGDPSPILALIHFVASPLRERGIGRNVHEAIRFITKGKPPRRLSL